MADLPGLSSLRISNGIRAYSPAANLANRQQTPNKHVPMVKLSGGLASLPGTTSTGPSSLRGNEWRRSRALAEHTAEDLASLNSDITSSGTPVRAYSTIGARFYSTTMLNYLCGSVANSMTR